MNVFFDTEFTTLNPNGYWRTLCDQCEAARHGN